MATILTLPQHQFLNRLRSLYNIDRSYLPELTTYQWIEFRDNPPQFLIRASDKLASAILREVDKRQSPTLSSASDESQ